MRALVLGVFLVAVGVSGAVVAANAGDAIAGTWLTNDGSSKVAIDGAQGAYNGRVIWLAEPDFPAGDTGGMAGKPKVDRQNPDATLRNRPVLGMTVLSGLHYAGNNSWQGGTLYAPATGKSYPCKATLVDGTLQLSVGGGLFSRTVAWTRVATAASNPP